jgi:hypothetical protein
VSDENKMRKFYQLEIPSLGLIGSPVETDALPLSRYFHHEEYTNFSAAVEESPELIKNTSSKKLVFSLRDVYPSEFGVTGIYRLWRVDGGETK